MTSDVLFINELKADITGVSISENIQINDLFEVSARQASFTNTFSLPKTERNIEIFQGLGIDSNNSNVPYRLQRFTYLRNGIQMFSNALGIVKETDKNFKINLYFNNNELFEVIKGKKVNDLTLSALNHTLSIENYPALLRGFNLRYAIADYGAQSGEDIILDYQSPSVRVKYIWDRIFSEAGFSYRYAGRGAREDYNPFLTREFTEAFMTADKGFKPAEGVTAPVDAILGVSQGNPDYSRFTITTILTSITNVPFTVNENLRVTSNFFDTSLIRQTTIAGVTTFEVQQDGYYSIGINGTFVGTQVQVVNFRMLSGTTLIEQLASFETGITPVASTNRYFFQAGQVFYFQLQALNQNNRLPLQYSYLFNFDIKLDNRNITINLSQYFNNINQTDFIKDICNYFGLTFRAKGTVYEFISYQELFTPFINYSNFNALQPVNYVFEDWSDKFSTATSESYTIGDYGRRNIFAYLYDNVNDNFADGLLEIDNDILESEQRLITRLFKAPDTTSERIANNSLIRFNLYQVEQDKVKDKSSAPYIFLPERKSGQLTYKRLDGVDVVYNGVYSVANFQGLNYQRSLNKWNSGLKNILQRQVMYKCLVNLNEFEVANIDFFKLKYIKQLGGLFYLNKITGFKNETLTQIELIKITPQEQIGEFSNAFSNDFNI